MAPSADDDAPEPEPQQREERRAPSPVVGVGASAGGIDALQQFFRAVPRGSGLAFVIVQHLDPDHPSTLTDMVERMTTLPVQQIENDVVLEPETVYVIPPNATLTLKHHRLQLRIPDQPRGQRYPVDSFLLSLASELGESAACVILSGTGSDGTIGLRAIKENGGLTLAQADAEYDGMMRSAVATGLVDFVLPASAMPAKLLDYFRHLGTREHKKGADGVRHDAADYILQIAALIRAHTGNDFKDYKDKTMARRVQRRMQVLQIDDPARFIELLRSNPREIDLLFQDLLIGVTHFFRDTDAFVRLERTAIPALFERKGANDIVRAWIPGCSTGEEAYSIAILLREGQAKTQSRARIQIFATDIDEPALEVARTGRYPEAIGKDLSRERLDRYFTREDGTYRVNGELREICLFSLHNILRDPPFSKLDLLSCRNLLIYLNAEVQERVLPVFHYALREEGFLFLGSSENVTRHGELFSTVDKAHRLFRRRVQAERMVPAFPIVPVDLPHRTVLPKAAVDPIAAAADRQVLDRYAPPYVLVSAEGNIVHASARTGKYLELPVGAPQANVLDMARSPLRIDIRAALHAAASSGRPIAQKNLDFPVDGGRQKLDITVHPLSFAAEQPLYLVLFQDLGALRPEAGSADVQTINDVQAANIRQLETELRASKERLQTTTEELESANEELRSSNEELSSINEELQSTNEQLETSREELQSINEELQTVNSELSARIEDLSRATSDMANLLDSTQIATVFLDCALRVQSFTPAAKEVFRLVAGDIGRPITDVRSRFRADTVQEDAERVLRTMATVERQVVGTDSDVRFAMRVLPYRTVDNVVGGVVLTFIDISRISATGARIDELTRDVRDRLESLETMLDLLRVGVSIVERGEGDQVRVNRFGAQLFGQSADFRGLRQITTGHRLLREGQDVPPSERPLATVMRTREPLLGYEARLVRPDGTAIDIMESAMPLFDDAGRPRGAIAAVVDITDRKRAEEHQQVLLHELQHRVKNILATISSLAARMLHNVSSFEEFVPAFSDRLMAMSNMHDLLFRRDWSGAEMDALVGTALSAFTSAKGHNIDIHGPKVLLRPDCAATLGMVLHELATNAAKYGALSSPKGRLDVSWQARPAPSGAGRVLDLSWVETDGPRVAPPDHEGFGSGFIRRGVQYELDGTADLRFEPAGLNCTISFPLPSIPEGGRTLASPGRADG